MIVLGWDREVARRLPGLTFWLAEVEGVRVAPSRSVVEELEREVVGWVRGSLSLESLRDHPVVRCYRDFFWRLGLDPTKVRPSGEALARRVLRGRRLPKISNVVDAYNLASLRTLLAFAAFDRGVLEPPLMVRFARSGEPFLGIGMPEPVSLKGRELVLTDARGIISVHPYRDAERSKVTEGTTSLLLVTGGVPGLDPKLVEEGMRLALNYITRVAGGRPSEPYSFSAPGR